MNSLRVVAIVLLCAALSVPASATAADFGSVEGFDLRWDTTLRASFAARTGNQKPSLLTDANTDDGDGAFRSGFISERMDFNSQLEISRGNLGFNLGMDGWYDAAYQTHNANHSAATFNPVSVSSNMFPASVRRLMGGTLELSNAYVRDRFEVAGIPVTVRVGRQTLLWGESLFFPQDGIAAAQAPVDVTRQMSQPLVEARELFLPVGQADVHVALPYGLSFEAFYQFEWRRDRTPGVASYFSSNDALDAGGQRAFLPGGGALMRNRDRIPSGQGQFGIALRRANDAADLGLYAIRYDSKQPQLATTSTTYQAIFPTGIELLGLSASTYLGDDTLAGELSQRWHMPLVSQGLAAVSAASLFGLAASPGGSFTGGPGQTGYAQTGYATGETLHALLSFEHQLRPARFWDAAVLNAEIVAIDLLRVETNPARRMAGTTNLATAVEVVFAPRFFQVRPGLDVTAQVGIQLGLSGRSSVDPGMVAGTGNVTFSVAAIYRTVWEAGVSFTHFIGAPSDQVLADRDFMTFSLSRTF